MSAKARSRCPTESARESEPERVGAAPHPLMFACPGRPSTPGDPSSASTLADPSMSAFLLMIGGQLWAARASRSALCRRGSIPVPWSTWSSAASRTALRPGRLQHSTLSRGAPRQTSAGVSTKQARAAACLSATRARARVHVRTHCAWAGRRGTGVGGQALPQRHMHAFRGQALVCEGDVLVAGLEVGDRLLRRAVHAEGRGEAILRLEGRGGRRRQGADSSTRQPAPAPGRSCTHARRARRRRTAPWRAGPTCTCA